MGRRLTTCTGILNGSAILDPWCLSQTFLLLLISVSSVKKKKAKRVAEDDLGVSDGGRVASSVPPSGVDTVLVFQEIQRSENFFIQPESKVASLDTSQWPLLLKVRVHAARQPRRSPSSESRSCDVMNLFIHSLSATVLLEVSASAFRSGGRAPPLQRWCRPGVLPGAATVCVESAAPLDGGGDELLH